MTGWIQLMFWARVKFFYLRVQRDLAAFMQRSEKELDSSVIYLKHMQIVMPLCAFHFSCLP